MRHTILLLLLTVGLGSAAQDTVRLTQIPPKPSCTPFLNTGACADLWRNYNQAVAQRQREELQVYVNRQKELASAAATAPLQQQITDLNKLVADQQDQIKKLQEQIQTDAAAALQAKHDEAAAAVAEAKKEAAAESAVAQATAHKEGMWKGIWLGAGAMLVLVIVLFVVRRFTRDLTITKKPQASSASA
jgi:cobalamin biosynthesis Mg chelatase CobN